MKARTQLTVAATAVVALLVALTGQFVVWRTDQHDRDDVDRALAARAAQIQTDATKSGRLPSDGVYAVRLMSGSQVRAQSGSKVQFSAPVKNGFSTVAAADGHDYRSWAETLPTGVQLQVLTDYTDVQARHTQAVRLVDLSVLIAILLGALGTWFTAGVVLRPLRRLQEGADSLTPDDLDGRLPSMTEPREVADLSASVNALLDRMQAAASARSQALAAVPPGRPFAPPPALPSGRPPALPEPTTNTVTPPPAQPATFPPRPVAITSPPVAPEPQNPRPSAPAPVKPAARDDEELRAALEKLGDDLDTLLDNPELTSTQRHLLLASIQNEYRRVVLMTQPD
jgi:HAMP domain-containing protein